MLKKVFVVLVLLGGAFGVMMLTTGDSRFEVEQTGFVAQSPETVWATLADVDRWSEWWPGLSLARLSGPLAVGSRIRLVLQGVPEEEPAKLAVLHPQQELTWTRAGLLGSGTGTRLLLRPAADGARVTVGNFVTGPQAFLARFTGEEAFAQYHELFLKSLELRLQGKLPPPAAGEKD